MVNGTLIFAPAWDRTSTVYVSAGVRPVRVADVASGPVRTPVVTWLPPVVVAATASTLKPVTASAPGWGASGVHRTCIEVLSADRTTVAEPAGATASAGPAGQPPKPGPPSSPNSAIVRPCRLPSASWTCQFIARSPRSAAAVVAAPSAVSKL